MRQAGKNGRRIRGRRGGMTLIEVLVAIVITTLGLVVLMDGMMAGQRANQKGDYLTLATAAAQAQIAQAQSLGYANLTNGTTTSSVSGLPSGQMTVTIGPLDGSAANTLITQVDVVVTWTSNANEAKSNSGQVKATTLVSK